VGCTAAIDELWRTQLTGVGVPGAGSGLTVALEGTALCLAAAPASAPVELAPCATEAALMWVALRGGGEGGGEVRVVDRGNATAPPRCWAPAAGDRGEEGKQRDPISFLHI
jgi:hypothetical protein